MKIECIAIRARDDFDQLYDKWEKAEQGIDMTVFQSFDWNRLLFDEWNHSKYNKAFSKIEVYVIENSGHVMIVPTLIQMHRTKLKLELGRERGAYILGHGSYSDYLNVICDVFLAESFQLYVETVKNKYCGIKLFFNNIREDSMLHKFLYEEYEHVASMVAVSIKVPQSKEEFKGLLSKHTRQNLRTAFNRMNKDHMEYEWKETGIIQNHELRHKMMVIHRKRMVEKNRSNRDIIHRVGAFLRTRLICYQETNNNIVQASMATMKNSVAVLVSLKGNVVGYIYGLKDKNGTIRVLQNSIDENYKFYSPMFRGIYDYIMENCETGELKELDFTRGDEEYKYKLGGQETQLFNYII